MKDLLKYSKNLISRKEFDFETLEMVLHSLNIIANKHKKNGDYNGERKFFFEKEFIMKKLLDPIYVEEIGDHAYIIYDAYKHRYRIPLEEFSLEEAIELYKDLPVVKHTKFHKCGEKIKGCLDEREIEEFYNMVRTNNYTFIS